MTTPSEEGGAKAPSTLPEKLAREIARVTKLRGLYETMEDMPRAFVAPALFLMDQSLEAAKRAAGSGDIAEMIAAVRDLEDFEE